MASPAEVQPSFRCLLAVLAAAALAGTTPAQEPPSANSSSPDPPTLTGDWGGCRTALEESGLTFDLSTTQFYQGIASGGLEQAFPYGGRNDYFLTVDGERLGLWRGLFVTLHGETRYGESANFLTGALSPVNEYLLVPAQEGFVTALTGVKFTQRLSEDTLIYAGKINLLDEIRQPLTGAVGLEGFLNTSLIFNTILARTLPYSTFGAGFVYSRDDHPVFAVSVYDTNDTPTVSGFNTFFDNGVTIFGIVNLPTRFFGLPGHQGLSGTYSTGRYTNVQGSSYLDPIEGVVVRAATKTGSWALAYNFDQAVWAATDDPERVWGGVRQPGDRGRQPQPDSLVRRGGDQRSKPAPGSESGLVRGRILLPGDQQPVEAEREARFPVARRAGGRVVLQRQGDPVVPDHAGPASHRPVTAEGQHRTRLRAARETRLLTGKRTRRFRAHDDLRLGPNSLRRRPTSASRDPPVHRVHAR
jgi:carbohydrate-selective porin OprB